MAGVSINLVVGEGGILTKAQNAATKTEEAKQKEQEDLDSMAGVIDNYLNNNPSEEPGNAGGETTDLLDISDFYVVIEEYSEHGDVGIYGKSKLYGDAHGYKIFYTEGGTTTSVECTDSLLRNQLGSAKFYVWLEDDDGNKVSVTRLFDLQLVCFEGNTLVSTNEGYKTINSLVKGDLVYSYNFENNKVELKEVTDTFYHRVSTQLVEITVGNEVITSTTNHPYYVKNKGWVGAIYLQRGDVLISKEGTYLEVKNVSTINSTTATEVYNLEVEGNHNYYVGNSNILVHNALAPAACNLENINTKVYGEIYEDAD